MAKILNFTNDQGINLPESYWRIKQINILVDETKAHVFFACYKDKDARLAGKETITSRHYVIFGEQFTNYYADVIDKKKNPAEVAYEFVSSLEEVPYQRDEEFQENEPVEDPKTGETTDNFVTKTRTVTAKRSFFAGATDDL